nr:acyltransferase [uncultured Roseateles sp.]
MHPSSKIHSAAHTSPRLQGLDSLRALAIFLVFAAHYMNFVTGQPTFGWASELGWVGVDLFFVLSGYLIANQIFAGLRRGQMLSLKHFYARRFLRTLPVFYLVLAAYFAFPAFMGGKTPPDLWRFLSFTQNWQLQPGTAFSHAWSLCVEEQFYLLLPAAVLLAQRWGKGRLGLAWLAIAGLIGLGMLARHILWGRYGLEAGGAVQGYYPNLYYATIARADALLPGVAVALLKNYHPGAWARVQARGQWVLALGLLACGAMNYGLLTGYYIEGYGYGWAMSTFGYSLNAIAFAILLMAALSPVSSLARLRVPGAQSLALWSYSIYLTHKAVMFALPKHLQPLGLERQSGLMLLAVAAVSVGLGWLLYRCVELPFMQWRDRLVPSSFASGPVRPTHDAAGSSAPLSQSRLA